MPKIMLIAYSLPPSPTGSATVTANLQWAASDQELVIAGAAPYPAVAPPAMAGRPQMVHISWRTPSFRGAGLLRLCQWPLSFLLAWYYLRKHRCDGIMGQFPNTEFLLMGYLLARVTGKKWYPYLHNSFADNLRRGPMARRVYQYLERKTFARAQAVFVISDGLKQYYEEKYGKKYPLVAMRHIYNETALQHPPEQPQIARRYALVGSVNPSNLSAAQQLIGWVLDADPSVTVEMSTGTPVDYLHRHGILRDRVSLTPHFSREELLAHLRSVDAVLLPHGHAGKLSEVEYRTIFPTKTIEYLICGRPILAFCPPGCFLSAFLEEHRCAELLTDEAPIEAITTFIREPELRKRLAENALLAAQLFSAEAVMQQWRTAVA